MSGYKRLSAKADAETKRKNQGEEREGEERKRKEEKDGKGSRRKEGRKRGREEKRKDNCLKIFLLPWGLALNYSYLMRMFHFITPQCPTNITVPIVLC